MKLLQHLNILTVTEAFSEEYGRDEGDIYFMPSLLQFSKADELDIQSKDSDPAHLLVWFNSGYVPVGVFSSMIINLELQKLKGWTLDKSSMKKDKLGFKRSAMITLPLSHVRNILRLLFLSMSVTV